MCARSLLAISLLSAIPTATAFSTTPRAAMKCSVYIACTLDGFIASPDGSVGFLDEYQSSSSKEDGDMGFSAFLDTVDVLVMGRKTWDQVVSFGEEMWPYGDRTIWIWSQQDPSAIHIPDIRAKQAKVISAAPPDILKLAEKEGLCHAYIDGGTTIRQFLKCGCVDELILTRVPLLLGGGVPLFASGANEQKRLEHVQTTAYSNGLVQSHYRMAKEA